MSSKNIDILGQILEAYVKNGSPIDELLIERDDGFITRTSLEQWVQPSDIPDIEVQQLSKLVKGTILDVGCGTGRHLRWLRDRGFSPYGIDISPGAIAYASSYVNDTVVVSSVWDYEPPTRFDNIIIMDNTVGLIGRISKLYPLLIKLATWINPGSKIAISSLDWRNPTNEIHKTYQDRNKRNYKGEVQLRLKYKCIEGDYFDWVWIDPDILMKTANQVGFKVHEMWRFGSKYYLTLQWKEKGREHDITAQEWILNSTASPGYNLAELSYGHIADDIPVRVEQFGPFRLSFRVPSHEGSRYDILQPCKIFENIANLLGIKPLIGGSMSPLSTKLLTPQSDYDFYLPVSATVTHSEVLSLAERLKSFDFTGTRWIDKHFSFIRESWLKLPYFYESVDPCNEADFCIWENFPDIARCEREQRLTASIDYLNTLQPEDILDDIERFYRVKIERDKIFRIIASPRWLSLTDSQFNRLRTIIHQDVELGNSND